MVYLKVVLDDRKPKSDETYSVVIRITFNRKTSTLATGVRIHKNHWDKSLHIVKKSNENYFSLNKVIAGYFAKVQKVAFQLEEQGLFSFEMLKESISKGYEQPQRTLLFKAFVEKIIAEMIEINKCGNAIIYQTASNRLLRYAGSNSLKFSQIDYSFLEGFKRELVKDGVKPNTISNYLRTIRAIYNKAIRAKIIDRQYYPFNEVQIKSERTTKRAVIISDIKRLYELPLNLNSRMWHARNYFLLSFSLIGISFTDMAYLSLSNIVKGRLLYRRRKTNKEYNIRLTVIARDIIQLYGGRNSKYLLPILPANVIPDSMEAKKIIAQWIKTTNKWLKRLAEENGIQEGITTYVARHTWATTAKRLGYSNEVIAEALGHEYGNKITNIYLDAFDKEVVDSLNEKVLEGLYLK